MLNLKAAVLTVVMTAGSFAAAPAFASGYEIFNGTAWVRNGTATVSGPTRAMYLGNTVPCTSTFTLTLTNGAAQVTNAVFAGSGACTAITKVLPWNLSAPTVGTGAAVNLTISGINITFAAPPATCTGSASGSLANANPNTGPATNAFTFSGTLSGGCAVSSNPSLTSSVPLRAYFP